MFDKNNSIKLNLDNIPQHIGLIMDGNGRWAKKRGLPRTAGHKAGAESLFKLVKDASDLGVKVMTVFAFSTENWKRSKEEVDYIFNLLAKSFKDKKESLMKNNIKVRMVGTLDRLKGEYDDVRETFIDAIESTKDNTGIILNIAFNYGGHDEIIRAVKEIAKDVSDNKIKIEDINTTLMESYLDTKGLPMIDLLIRTSGEQRISNFLLWQLAYSEMIFTPTYWPDFHKEELIDCLKEYQNRDRRFGNVK